MADPHHAHSPQHTSPRKGKYLPCQVVMLDDSTDVFHVPQKAYGGLLYNDVCRKLQLMEVDYFDLEFTDHEGNLCWLDREKPILKQVPYNDFNFRFLVKFYTPDPGLLEDELTRYLFALQIKRDLSSGAMPCQEHTAVLLASFIVQSEIGDFMEDEYTDHTYLSNTKLLPNQTEEIEHKIMEHHKEHIGQSPAAADYNLLDTARKVELYGIRMHPAKDHEGVSLHLAVAHMGVLVFQNYTKINTFSWAKIRKLSFKRKRFLIKLHPDGYEGYYKDTVEFYFGTRNECKNFWKKCIEHHAFFRCHNVKRLPRNKTRVVSRGSSFRYSGKTQKQLVEFVRANFVKRQPFERKSTSMRTMSTVRSTGATPNTGTLNSRDYHFANTSGSSGSHTLEMQRSRENVQYHEDPGSYYANKHSPRADQEKMSMSREFAQTNSREMAGTTANEYQPEEDHQTGYSQKIDPAKFMLSRDDRKMSAPVFSVTGPHQENDLEDPHLARSPEVTNIPEEVDHDQLEEQNRLGGGHIIRTQSATVPDHAPHHGASLVRTTTIDEEPLPPPPPPIYQQSNHQKTRPPPRREETLFSNSRSTTTTSAASVTLTSNTSASVTSSKGTEDSEEDGRRKRYPADKAYYIAKELLMTERTYKKDLEVVTVWFRNAVSKDDVLPDNLADLIFSNLDPLYEFHISFLKDIETRLHMWEGKSNAHLNGEYQKIGDVMLNGMNFLEIYKNFLEHHEEILNELEFATKRNKQFEQAYKDFESQKVCYLPLNTFILKPAQRLLHYKLILERLLKHYDPAHSDFTDCQEALALVSEVTSQYADSMLHLENLQKLIELQRDLVGLDSLVLPNRTFIREGCLQKLSRKGYQQRMFFLFSDMMVYTSRTATPMLQFKVHGQLALRGMVVEETDVKMAVANSFTIYAGNRCLLLAASSQEEKDKWLEDLRAAIEQFKDCDDGSVKNQYPSLKSNSSSEALEDSHEEPKSPPSPDRQMQHRANTTMHVCWHRNTSVSMKDHSRAIENQLSGYLLRKFKNSMGWQKLWVVFTNFCLFFYKTYQDDFPLASLPLLGYSVTTPDETDGIHKDYVFKLQFKNHVYFFRAESEYTFERWIEVINSATSTAKRTRLFSRMDSNYNDL